MTVAKKAYLESWHLLHIRQHPVQKEIGMINQLTSPFYYLKLPILLTKMSSVRCQSYLRNRMNRRFPLSKCHDNKEEQQLLLETESFQNNGESLESWKPSDDQDEPRVYDSHASQGSSFQAVSGYALQQSPLCRSFSNSPQAGQRIPKMESMIARSKNSHPLRLASSSPRPDVSVNAITRLEGNMNHGKEATEIYPDDQATQSCVHTKDKSHIYSSSFSSSEVFCLYYLHGRYIPVFFSKSQREILAGDKNREMLMQLRHLARFTRYC